MKVANLKAEPNSRGGQIDLVWSNPDAAEFSGVKILRREASYPELPADLGSSVVIHDEPAASTPGGAVGRFSDTGLKSETVYYYAVAAYDASPAYFPAFVSAMATGAYQSAETMYSNLPALYQRFDSLLPPDAPSLDASSRNSGQLRRLIEMFGEQFDLLRSFASGTRYFSSIDRIDGELLPLRAGWIGWQTDFASPLHKQRNEIKYAPSYYRTTGIVANLRATLNRLTTWDPQVKEFVHNIFLSNAAEQLTIHETERAGGTWLPTNLVTLDVAYEGRPAALQATDGRSWLFYHARETVPLTRGQGKAARTEDRWHLWYKINDQDEWLPSRRIASRGSINKFPAAVERADGSLLVFWSSFEGESPESLHQLRLQLLASGRAARPPRLRGTAPGPFFFADGSEFDITIKHGLTSIDRRVTLHSEHFRNIAAATANEVAALLDSEIPGVEVTAADDGTIVITSVTSGAASTLTVAASSVADALGLPVAPNTVSGSDATHGQLTGSTIESFTLKEGESLAIRVDGGPERLVTFSSSRMPNLSSVSAAAVVAAINDVLPGIATVDSKHIKLISPTAGDTSSIAVEVIPAPVAEASAARFIPVESIQRGLGFGAPLPRDVPASDDIEPAVCKDNTGNIWLFWSSRRSGVWKIWYNRFDGNSWGVSQQLTTGIIVEREPAVVFDPGTGAPGSGTIWVFWSRKNVQRLWNIFYCTSANVSFPLAMSGETELAPISPDRDRRESAPLLLGPHDIELFFSSNGTDGWQVWSEKINPVTPANDGPITTGQFTQRAPAVLQTADGRVRLLYRSNESRSYISAVYPSARTLDSRYSGSTTVDTRNAAKIGLRGAIDDVQRYTYDARRVVDALAPIEVEEEPPVWYARDTIGIYLTPDTTDEGLIIRNQQLIESLLRSFLPIQLRVVFIVREAVSDFVYTYSRTGAGPQHLIGEQTIDTLLSDVLGSITDSFADRLTFRFMRSWDGIHPNTPLPDFSVSPAVVSSRLFLSGAKEGE